MRTLFVTNLYPPNHLGGYEMLCHEVAAHLMKRGHQVDILTSTFGMEKDREEQGIFRKLRLECDIHHYHPSQVFHYWMDRQTNCQTVTSILHDISPDVVVVWGMWKLSREIALWIEELAGSRVVYYVSDQWLAEPGAHRSYWDEGAPNLSGRLFKGMFRIPVRLALRREWQSVSLRLEHVMVCSKAVRDQLVQSGVPVDHARVIYHGIDPVPYQKAATRRAVNSSSKTLRIVYVGTLAPHKGVHTAVEAVGHLTGAEPSRSISLAILGAGHPQYERRLHELVDRCDLDDRVAFHSPIPRDQLPAFLAQFDVLVMPSVYEEPQARISQEAMAAGLVLVATLTGGTKEILVDEENGLAFEPEDSQNLAWQLSRLAQNASLRQRLKSAGWQTISERFTIDRMIDEFESYLNEVVSQ